MEFGRCLKVYLIEEVMAGRLDLLTPAKHCQFCPSSTVDIDAAQHGRGRTERPSILNFGGKTNKLRKTVLAVVFPEFGTSIKALFLWTLDLFDLACALC